MTGSTSEQLKRLGNELFKLGKLAEAIQTYSQAIALDESNYVLYSNRSAAYLKSGDASKALEDAEKCLSLNPDFAKGYHRKGAALHSLLRFNDSITAFKEGLEKFPDDGHLATSLNSVMADKELTPNLRRKRVSVAISSNKKQAPESVSEFVANARSDIKLQMLALQTQLDVLDNLAKLTDDQKRVMLFDLLDKDNDGSINAQELADSVRKGNEDLSFSESLERAIDFVALFDDGHDGKLNQAEFNNYLDSMLKELGSTFHELSEFLVLQALFGEGNDSAEEAVGEIRSEEIDEEVRAREEYYDALSDERMSALFSFFDVGGDGFVDFTEVAVGLYKLSNNMEESTKAAVNLMLMVDKDDLQRTLDFEQFALLMMNFCALSNVHFSDVADSLTLTMASNKGKTATNEEIKELIIADEMYQVARAAAEKKKEASEILDTLHYAKLHRLFDLWDNDHDNRISYQELLLGMRKFEGAMDIDKSIQRAAKMILKFDAEGDQALDRVEFAKAMTTYAHTLKRDVHELIDFMVVTSVLKENDAQEAAYIESISNSATSQIERIQGRLESVDVDDDEEE